MASYLLVRRVRSNQIPFRQRQQGFSFSVPQHRQKNATIKFVDLHNSKTELTDIQNLIQMYIVCRRRRRTPLGNVQMIMHLEYPLGCRQTRTGEVRSRTLFCLICVRPHFISIRPFTTTGSVNGLQTQNCLHQKMPTQNTTYMALAAEGRASRECSPPKKHVRATAKPTPCSPPTQHPHTPPRLLHLHGAPGRGRGRRG